MVFGLHPVYNFWIFYFCKNKVADDVCPASSQLNTFQYCLKCVFLFMLLIQLISLPWRRSVGAPKYLNEIKHTCNILILFETHMIGFFINLSMCL